MNKPATLWYAFDKENNIWNYNHIEDGHISEKPIPRSDAQSWWKNARWSANYKYIDENGRVVDHE
jgi:hypothetical protein